MRNADTCTCRLFSSTTSPGQTQVEQFVLGNKLAGAFHQYNEHVKCTWTDALQFAVGEQAPFGRLQGETAEAVFGGSDIQAHGQTGLRRSFPGF